MISGASKIPTIIYYDQDGEIQAVGAEATEDGIYETAIDQGWKKAEWCVLLVLSKRIPILMNFYVGSSYTFDPNMGVERR